MNPEIVRLVIWAAVAASAAGVWWLMPQRTRHAQTAGLIVATLGLIAGIAALGGPQGELDGQILFWIFAGAAALSGVLMITSHNPVYAALWFAVATLGVCGLFMLLSAPFLAAATIIVYAGAIVVTFLFVIMMAQQSGGAMYDRRTRTPVLAVLASFFLLGALLWTFEGWQTLNRRAEETGESGPRLSIPVAANPLSQPTDGAPLGSMKALGRSLFGDSLFSVEIAGTLLLAAAIGAIAIAPRRQQGTL